MKTLTNILQKKTAVFSFGRMNPPTLGHECLMKYVLECAKDHVATPAIFISKTSDSNKNPLTFEQKLKYIKLSFPEMVSYFRLEESIKTPIDALNHLIAEGYNNFIFVVGEDRLETFSNTFSAYIKGKPHGALVESFCIVSVGRRFESLGIEGISSSKMRSSVESNNYQDFRKNSPTHLSDKFCLEMFYVIQKTLKPNKNQIVENLVQENIDINTNMRTFKTFLVEADGQQQPSNLALAIKRQKREVDDQDKRHAVELEKARETDFKSREDAKRKKEQDRDVKNDAKYAKMHRDRELRFKNRETERKTRQAQKSAEKEIKRHLSTENTILDEYDIVVEYLEDGTLELVTAYKKGIPGQ